MHQPKVEFYKNIKVYHPKVEMQEKNHQKIIKKLREREREREIEINNLFTWKFIVRECK